MSALLSSRPRSLGPLLLAPLRVEARALRRGARGAAVVRTGMRSGAVPPGSEPLLVAGFAGALTRDLAPGTVVVASEVAAPEGDVLGCDASVAGDLERAGVDVRVGRIATATRIVRRSERSRLAGTGAVAVDLESYWLRRAAGSRPFAAVRVIVDTPVHELTNPLATLRAGVVAYRTLARAAGSLAAWRPDTLNEPNFLNEEPCPSP